MMKAYKSPLLVALAVLNNPLMANENAPRGIGAMANQINGSMTAIAELIGGVAYVAGLAFFVGALLKFKQHRDNPTQTPIGTPFTYFGISVCLVFLPNLLSATGETVFTDPKSKGATGAGFGSLGIGGEA